MSKSIIISSALTGALFFFLNEYMALLPLGRIFSFGLGFGVVILAISSATRGLLGFLIVSIFSATENRQLSTLHDVGGIDHQISYFSFFTTAIAGLNLYVWILLSLTLISLIRLAIKWQSIKLGRSFNLTLVLAIFLVMMLSATVMDLPLRSHINYKYIVSDFRPLLVFLMGIIITIDVKNDSSSKKPAKTFVSLVKFLATGLGVQLLLTLVNDLFHGELRFQFTTSPHIMWPLFFTYILSGKYLGAHIGFFSLAGAFKVARGEMLNVGISIVMLTLFFGKLTSGISRGNKLNIFNSVTVIFMIIAIILAIANAQYPYIIDFIIFKFSFFINLVSGEISSSSVSMRVTELQNILSFYWNNVEALFWGRGFGGYFTFSEFPPSRALAVNDFSIDQISSGLFYKPHHFVNFILLKAGIIGFLLYLLFSYKFFVTGLQLIRLGDVDERIVGYYLFFFSLYSLNMYWQPVLILWALFVYSYGEIILRSIKN